MSTDRGALADLEIPEHLTYRRDLGFSAGPGPGNELVISAELEDPEHEIRLTLSIDPEGTVQSASLREEQTPLRGCRRLEELDSQLVGLDVQATTPEDLENLGLERCCFHVWELVGPAFRFATNVLAMCRVGWKAMNPPGPETPEKMREAGLDRCVAFSAEENETDGSS